MPAAPDPSLDLRTLNASFRLALLGENKSERTVEAYTDAVRFFADFLEASGHPLTVTAITRDHIRGFIADQRKRWKPATAHNRYRGLHSFFTWAVDELDELPSHLMNGMKPPHIPEEPVPVLIDDQLRRLLKACEGKDFTALRDTAIIRLLMDTGLRRSECVGIMLAELDLKAQLAVVLGKGGRPRVVPFGRKTALALDRYIRARAKHRPMGICRTCGLVSTGPRPHRACSRWSPIEVPRLGCMVCIRTSSAIRSRMPGWMRREARAT
jgi:integrase/recombinase XerC